MIRPVPPLEAAWFDRAAAHQAQLTMPAGALGRLLDLARQLCAIQETLAPHARPAAVLVMAADHGIAAEGISAYPAEVTGQMVANFLRGGAAVNVLARQCGARVLVIDLGVKHRAHAGPHPDLIDDSALGPGTANFLHGPAMSLDQAEAAIGIGQRVVAEHLVSAGTRAVVLGEMGIGNTTSASALTAALTGQPPALVTGRGTGIDEARHRHKIAVIEQSLRLHGLGPTGRFGAMEALARVGGFEIAGMVGAALEAASRRMVILLDGFISSVAGLIAVRLCPGVREYLIATHRSVEAGHHAVLDALGLVPLLDLGLRLGEGSGAVLALPLLESAAAIMREMATFEAAAVAGPVR